jgi:Lrp/AsnC family transcriptional regulator, leucine-responsive regulatory protein
MRNKVYLNQRNGEYNLAIILDGMDKAILRELQDDASISNLTLSKKIGLSPSACLARTKNLVETGIIKKFATLVDEKKLGMEVLAFALVNLSPLNRETIHIFLEEVKRFPQVQECYTLTGSHDYLLKIVAKDMESYRDFIIDSLMQNTTISRVETSMVMGIEKRSVYVPIDES